MVMPHTLSFELTEPVSESDVPGDDVVLSSAESIVSFFWNCKRNFSPRLKSTLFKMAMFLARLTIDTMSRSFSSCSIPLFR